MRCIYIYITEHNRAGECLSGWREGEGGRLEEGGMRKLIRTRRTVINTTNIKENIEGENSQRNSTSTYSSMLQYDMRYASDYVDV